MSTLPAEIVRLGSICTMASYFEVFKGGKGCTLKQIMYIPLLRRMDLGISDYSFGC